MKIVTEVNYSEKDFPGIGISLKRCYHLAKISTKFNGASFAYSSS